MADNSKIERSEKMDMLDWRMSAYGELLNRLPQPIRMFDDCAICPWCGEFHTTITFGQNICGECRRGFLFGFPPWESAKRMVSWVHMRLEEEDMAISNIDLMPLFEPNKRLQQIYKLWRDWDAGNDVEPNSQTLH